MPFSRLAVGSRSAVSPDQFHARPLPLAPHLPMGMVEMLELSLSPLVCPAAGPLWGIAGRVLDINQSRPLGCLFCTAAAG